MMNDYDLLDEFERMLAELDSDNNKISNPKNGDHVIYAGKHKARVISGLKDGKVRIKYDDENLIPSKENVPIEYLTKGDKSRIINTELHCPRCDVPWKASRGFHLDVYYDCPKCGLKKEDVVG